MPRTSVLSRATHVTPNAAHRDTLSQLAHASAGGVLVLHTADGDEITLPPELVEVVLTSAGELAEGHAITILASETMLTPAEAGELLGLSRPFISRLMDEGKIPAHYLPSSTHRVIKLADVLAFAARRDRRAEGRRKFVEAAEAAGLPY